MAVPAIKWAGPRVKTAKATVRAAIPVRPAARKLAARVPAVPVRTEANPAGPTVPAMARVATAKTATPGRRAARVGAGGQGAGGQGAGGQEAGNGGLGGGAEGSAGESGSWPGDGAGGAGGRGAAGRVSEAESIFNESLEDFDEIMGAEQEAIARSGVGTAADEGFGSDGASGAGGPGGEGADGAGGQPTGGQAGGSGESDAASGRRVLARAVLSDEPPETVEGCEDDDTVARQLCEAATKEEDPLLRAALWDEYNEYKSILAGQ